MWNVPRGTLHEELKRTGFKKEKGKNAQAFLIIILTFSF